MSVETSKWNEDDTTNFSHAVARRLPAEVLLDAVYRVTGSTSNFPGVPAGTRAASLPDAGVELPSGFLTTFGRPARESSCECERSDDLQLGPVMALVSGPTLADAIADKDNELTRLVSREVDNAKLVNDLFLRILNRPATEGEIQACLADLELVDEDHRELAEALGKKEVEFALQRPQLEREREASIAKATSALSDYEAEYAPKRAEQEKAKAEQTAKLEGELKAYEATLPSKLAEWEKQQTTAVTWRVLTPSSTKASNDAKLSTEPDGSIVVTEGSDENGVITIVAETDLKDITGVRLEVMSDPRFPKRGPGRAPDGNFVLNEFTLNAAPKSDRKQTKPVKLRNALADFSQENFEVAKAIDDNPRRPSGWAVSPTTGVTHWATFETTDALGHDGGTVLTFQLRHNYDKGYMPGRVRLSATSLSRPIRLGLAEEYRSILAMAPEIRTDAQRDALLTYFRTLDPEWRKRRDAVNASKAPLPEDTKLVALRQTVEDAKQPVPVDPALVRLRRDLEQSIQQSTSKRLTVAQDIAWALINSPAFLFNH